jgi:hypothetical protein
MAVSFDQFWAHVSLPLVCLLSIPKSCNLKTARWLLIRLVIFILECGQV